MAAASARLCVETKNACFTLALRRAAASARLCVETLRYRLMTSENNVAAASARLCVETPKRK